MQMFLRVCVVLIACMFTVIASAQLPENLSNYKASMITDDQLKRYIDQATKTGLSQDQVEDELRKRGLPESEIMLLHDRVKTLQLTSKSNQPATKNAASSRKRSDLPETVSPPEPDNERPPYERIFGSELFNRNSDISFETNLRIPTPSNYKLGPDDQLIVDIFGINQSQQTVTVSPEGAIKLNYVGPVYVNGLTVDEAKNRIISNLSKVYPAIRGGGTKVQVSLGAIRSIKVTLLGAVVKPGTYTLPSLATLFNALYSSGGPDDFGSFRTIELIRNNKVIEKVDIYRFLLSGDQSQNVRLEDMDVIRIPVAKTKVQVGGEVRRQGTFELLPGETLGKLINDYSGGFQKTAYTAIIRSERITDREKQLIDIPKDRIDTYIPQDGDIYNIDKILDRYTNAINITGAVFRPGKYSLQPGMKITDLLNKADGLREDVYADRALLYRLKDDRTKEIIAVDLKTVINGGANNIELRRDDSLVVTSISELSDEYVVTLSGAVRKPANYVYRENMSIKDLVLQAGGFTEEASLTNIDIARRKKLVDPNDPKAVLSDVLAFSVDTISLSMNQQDFKLQPHDIVSVKTNPFKKPQELVTVEGQVLFPGPYAILSRQERLSSVIKRSGNPLAEANIAGASLKRKKTGMTDKTAITKMSEQARDSTNALPQSVTEEFDDIALDLDDALLHPGGQADIYLQDGDVITIPHKDEMVNIEGEVLHPVKINYEAGKRLRHYINAAGGFVSSANKDKVFVVYANGKAARTRSFLFIRNYPKVKEGSQIFVPKYIADQRPKKSAAEIAALLSAVASLSYVIIIIANSLK